MVTYRGTKSNGLPTCVIVRDGGERCKMKWGFDNRGRCKFAHQGYALPGEPQCAGETKAGVSCRREPRPNSAYCSPQHDPTNGLLDPAQFRIDSLRRERESIIARRDRYKDIYTGHTVNATDRKHVELDHVLEFQAINPPFTEATKDCDEPTREWLKSLLARIMNENDNLGLTTKNTNALKAKAFKAFLDLEPLAAQRHAQPNLRSYLDTQLDESNITQEIVRRVQVAYEFVKKELELELTNVLGQETKKKALKRFINELDRMATAMGLEVEEEKAASRSETASAGSKEPSSRHQTAHDQRQFKNRESPHRRRRRPRPSGRRERIRSRARSDLMDEADVVVA